MINLNLNQILVLAFPYLILLAIIVISGAVTLGFYYYFFHVKRRRKWKVEVHELKADGKLHSVGRDILLEKKMKFGTVTYYWMKLARQEAIPPPSEVVDRFSGKEEVDYLRIEREFVPAKKALKYDYNDPEIKKKVIKVYDAILNKIHGVKTTFFSSDKAIADRFINIPIHKTLTAKIEYSPIPYDMNMLAVNEISNADAHFASQFEFWKKYGAIIVFATTVIFLLIMAVLTYSHLEEIAKTFTGQIGQTNGILQGLVDKMAGTGKPPV